MNNLRGSLYGIFDSLISEKENTINIRLLETKPISFDLIFNDEFYNQNIKKILSDIELKYTNYSDREMIYFICVRKKIRFIPKQYNKKYFTIALFKDEKKVERVIKIPFARIYQMLAKDRYPDEIVVTENKIVFQFGEDVIHQYIYDVADYLKIDLSNSSKIVYVGETDFPLDRPFDKAHLGMMRAIYNYKNFGNDIFIYYNLFQVNFISINDTLINYIASNGLLDYIDKRAEVRFIQNALIWHLLPSNYSKNYRTEIGELKNTLNTLKKKINLKEVVISYEIDWESDMYLFHSDLIKHTRNIGFKISENENIFA